MGKITEEQMTQPTLFDQVKSRDQFSGIVAKQLRDAGMKKAVDHANAVSPNWSEKAYKRLLEFIDRVPGEFMIEDVRAFSVLDDGFEMPPNSKAWGSVVVRAFKAGIIKRVRYDQAKGPKCHMTTVSVWIKA